MSQPPSNQVTKQEIENLFSIAETLLNKSRGNFITVRKNSGGMTVIIVENGELADAALCAIEEINAIRVEFKKNILV